jgi:hypothetical protein
MWGRVVGLGDLPEAAFPSDSLTTVRHHPAEVARHGVDRLIQAIAREAVGRPQLVPIELIIRESGSFSGGPARRRRTRCETGGVGYLECYLPCGLRGWTRTLGVSDDPGEAAS